ncbi:hypothetical protein H4O18_04935 [Arenibacter sp. BSSL-BM3]|uniref:Uncharacterized protein n=1 Tax=Arenibacter arenosicollis TaxID=2762274 RepID=A0ABR7QJG3_9FLAO|nr:hypothetical protein [Arenibacter arenosicollis]MBC8767330.1 hypothetical protein [Arenibacter arenosicollis]
MKKTIALLSIFCSLSLAQATNTPKFDDIVVGSELMIGSPSSNLYEHIKLPRMNFIIKKGGIPNYKTLFKSKVVVSDKKELPDGSIEVYLKRKNGKPFFNSHRQIKAKLKEAINAKELVKL